MGPQITLIQKWTGIAAIAIVSMSASWAPSLAFGAAALDLRQAVQYAVDHSPTVNTRQRELESRRMELRNSVSSFLPSLDFEAVQGYQDVAALTQESTLVNRLSLSLTENLYDNGTDWIRYSKSKLAVDRAQVLLDEERNRVSLDAASAYLDYSSARKSLEVSKEQHALLLNQFRIVEARYRQGLKTKRDYVRLSAEVLRSEQTLRDDETRAKKSEAELRRVLGEPLGESTALEFLVFALEDLMPTQVPAVAPPLETQLIWRVSELERELESRNVDLAKREYFPRLYLTGGLEYVRSGYLDREAAQIDAWGWNALATLRINLWDWGKRRRDIAIAENNKEVVSNQLTSTLLTRRSEVEATMLELRRANDAVRLNRELLKMEKQSYALVESEYRGGRAEYLDLITALSNLASARLSGLASAASLQKALFQYQYYQGTLYGEVAKR